MMPSMNRLSATCGERGLVERALRYLPEVALCFAAVAALFVMHDIPITHDVVWQFWVARQLSGGAALYRDIWEINPPLWFWSAVPIHHVAGWLHTAPLRLLVALIVGMGALSAWLTGHLAGMASLRARLTTMLLAFWLIVVMPLYDFGQREQLALICALPYAALLARRSTESAVSVGLALLVGTMGAYGFALKHYFVAVPIMLEVWLIFRDRAKWRILRPETLLLAVGALLYGLAVVIFAPGFLTDAVPMARIAYHGYESSWEMMFFRPWIVIWTFILAFFLTFGRAFGKRANPLVSTLLIAALGFAFAYFLQRKGWLYHSVPVTGAFALALTVRMEMADLRRPIPVIVGSLMLTLPLLMPLKTGPYLNWFRAEIDPILTTVPRGSPVYIATAEPMWGWPTIEDHDLIWPSRLSTFWMIPAIAHAEMIGPDSPSLRMLGKKIQDQAALEIGCSSPAFIFFERRRNYVFQPIDFDVRDFFLRQANLRIYMKRNYRELKPTSRLYIYQRVTPPNMMRMDPKCPVLPSRPDDST
jgi:hypothetical protein